MVSDIFHGHAEDTDNSVGLRELANFSEWEYYCKKAPKGLNQKVIQTKSNHWEKSVRSELISKSNFFFENFWKIQFNLFHSKIPFKDSILRFR